ncbi:MAG: MoxR family ATPase [Victivallales bacterium]|nr:MoxR family ATPase [Victivallales bacterium]
MEQAKLQKLQAGIQKASAFVEPLKTEIGRVMVGQEKLIDAMILALISDGHILLEGLPGLAKTLAVKTLSQALDGSFSRIQFTPDLLPADVVGTKIYNPKEHTFTARIGPVFTNILLADEINRAPAKVQSALLECMQEKQVTLGGEKIDMPSPFLVLATQNPIEQEGTYPLPEAQVDRFMFKILVDYPSRDEEKMVIERMAHPVLDLQATPVATLDDVLKARQWVDSVYIDEKIVEYILDITIATRPGQRFHLSDRQGEANLSQLDNLILYGASPRASIMLTVAAKAAAFIEGRPYVVPQDVKNVAHNVLRHRILLTYEAEAEEITSEKVIQTVLDELRTP